MTFQARLPTRRTAETLKVGLFPAKQRGMRHHGILLPSRSPRAADQQEMLMSRTALFAAVAFASLQLFVAGLEFQSSKAQRYTSHPAVTADQVAGGH
ncbi:MAG: hypothetical protein CTY20_06185 [Hyphomicrobium sp.]|nr:MAG: hypothetical protein CTY20_06185 [Hyphomicrobium sp.]